MADKKISKQTRSELLELLRQRYQRAAKPDKGKILDEFVAVAGCLFCPNPGILFISRRMASRPKGRMRFQGMNSYVQWAGKKVRPIHQHGRGT
jgi:hypothetical protein